MRSALPSPPQYPGPSSPLLLPSLDGGHGTSLAFSPRRGAAAHAASRARHALATPGGRRGGMWGGAPPPPSLRGGCRGRVEAGSSQGTRSAWRRLGGEGEAEGAWVIFLGRSGSGGPFSLALSLPATAPTQHKTISISLTLLSPMCLQRGRVGRAACARGRCARGRVVPVGDAPGEWWSRVEVRQGARDQCGAEKGASRSTHTAGSLSLKITAT